MSKLLLDPDFFEKYLLNILFVDDDLRDKILPFVTEDLFEVKNHKFMVSILNASLERFGRYLSPQELLIKLNKNEDAKKTLTEIVNLEVEKYSKEMMLEEIEEFIRRHAIWKELESVVDILKNPDSKTSELGDLHEKIKEISSFSLNTDIGLDLFESVEEVYDGFHADSRAIPTGIKEVDLMVGGFHEHSLTLFMGQTNIGKTLVQCSFASAAIKAGKNVLYITFEEDEKKLSRRIVANLADMGINDLAALSKEDFVERFGNIVRDVKSKMVVKDYPEGSISASHLRSLLIDLKNKKGFVPDIVFCDYIGCLIPNRMTSGMNEYLMFKKVSGEIRALSMEFGMPWVSAMQLNRGGYEKVDVDLTDAADSIGPATKADIIFAISQNEEMRAMGVYKFNLLKNRFGENKKSCMVNVDYPKMRLSSAGDSLKETETPQNVALDLEEKRKKLHGRMQSKEKSKIVEFD